MKLTSQAYNESINQPFRDLGYCNVIIYSTNSEAALYGEWIASSQFTGYSSLDNLDYELDYNDNFITLELNSWILDGYIPFFNPDGRKQYIGSTISADWSANELITKKLEDSYLISAITLTFGTEHPLAATVGVYKNNVLVAEQTKNITSSVEIFDEARGEIDEVRVEITSNMYGRRAKLKGLRFGMVLQFTEAELINATLKTDVDALARRLPDETLEFTVIDENKLFEPSNPDGLYEYMYEGLRVSVQYGYLLPDGSIEWLAPDYYNLVEPPNYSLLLSTFKCESIINSLNKTYALDTWHEEPRSLYDIAELLLENAGLPPNPDGSNPWYIDDSLRDIYYKGLIDGQTAIKELLQQIAYASCCALFTSDGNQIHIEPIDLTGSLTIDNNTIYSDSVVSSISPRVSSATYGTNEWALDFLGNRMEVYNNWFYVKNTTPYGAKVYPEDSIFPDKQNFSAMVYGLANTVFTVYSWYPAATVDAPTEADAYEYWLYTEYNGNHYAPIVVKLLDYEVVLNSAWGLKLKILEDVPSNLNVRIKVLADDIVNNGSDYDISFSGDENTIIDNGSSYSFDYNNVPYGEDNYDDKGESYTSVCLFMGSKEQVMKRAEFEKNYFKLRTNYDFEYRGNPELECKDVINLQTPYKESAEALVLVNEFYYDGSFHGKLKVKLL